MKDLSKELINLGERISRRRKNLRLSQKELASRSGVSQSAIAQIEAGRNNPSFEMLANIASSLNTTYAELISDQALPKAVELDPSANLKKNLELIKNYLTNEIDKIPSSNKLEQSLPGLNLIPQDVYELLSDIALLPGGVDMIRSLLMGVLKTLKA